uniref:Uncharacterized protein n=1 Tax=Cyclopterus lumpus TaxID=8103 RepID=A0A8C3G4J5_CYCLU
MGASQGLLGLRCIQALEDQKVHYSARLLSSVFTVLLSPCMHSKYCCTSTGEKGPAGSRGSQGPKGQIGVPGPWGRKGLTGPAGDTGVKGATGDYYYMKTEGAPLGIQGPRGHPGSLGYPGDRGIPGTPGRKGKIV